MLKTGRLQRFIGWLLFTIVGCTVLVQAAVKVPVNLDHSWFAPLARQSLLTAIDHSPQAIYLAGERGHILKKNKERSGWEQADVPTQSLLTAVFMLDNRVGWAVGHDAVILQTVDGGSSWFKRFEAPVEQRPLLDVWFKNQNDGIAVGAYGYFLQTSDGGKNWESRLINEEHDFHLNAITASPEGDLYVAAESGYVYRSRDQGKTWDVLDPPYEGSFFDVLAFQGGRVVVVGLRGHAFISGDYGESWGAIDTGTQVSLNAAIRLQGGQVLIAGHAGMLFLSDPELKHLYPYQFPDRKALSGMAETDVNRIGIVGESGFKSVNLCRIYHAGQLAGCP